MFESIREGDGAMEEELSGDDGIGVEAGLADKGLDLLEALESLTICQQRSAELLGMIHSNRPLQPSQLPPFFFVFHIKIFDLHN